MKSCSLEFNKDAHRIRKQNYADESSVKTRGAIERFLRTFRDRSFPEARGALLTLLIRAE